MSGFLDELGRELEAAARRRAQWRPGFASTWSRRTVALVAAALLALIAVPAAAVTGVFSGATSAPGPESTQPGLVDVGPPCVDKRERKLQTTTAPLPADLTALLAVLRRPQLPSDRVSEETLQRLAPLPVESVNPDTLRQVATGRGDVLLVPAANVRFSPPLPDTEGCRRFAHPDVKPVPGVCYLERGGNGGGGCADIDGIRKGLTMLTSGGRRHGMTRATGIAHDGVTAVIWRVHRGKRFLDTRIPVHDNVYSADVPGRAGHGLYVYFETPAGRKLVRGPHRYTKRELAQARRSKERDKNASPTPTVTPQTGTTKTVFTFRMRVAPKSNKVYVATWKPPAGSACSSSFSIGMVPALRGELKGLIKSAFGPPPATGRWCPGKYSGTVRTQRRGRRGINGPVIARFSFSVRG